MSLTGKRIVILGGSSGLGFATAKAAAAEGAQVVIASSNAKKVADATERLESRVEGRVVDLFDERGIAAFFDAVGAFDHLVYTAGDALKAAELKEMTFADAQAAFGIRYWGALLATKYGAAKIRVGGSIVLTSGLASQRARKGWSVISSVCGATESFARALAVELAPVRVNVVSPGTVRTELWDGLPDAARDAMFQKANQLLPVAHAGEPSEVAETYLYFMRSGFVTGSIAYVDGGAGVMSAY
ncbi:MAG: SDR family oxidoreductase [Paraburkholderia sp.]|uniref:SDR family oxidoreductase n=1 Tax=Paraburkholderia sp. TaxID=1926495 RepID=UPI003C4696A7